MRTGKIKGVLSPVLTPFRSDYTLDEPKFLDHCHQLTQQNVGLAVFGTNSEGNSLTIGEKRRLLDVLVENGIEPDKMMPGTGSCAIGDAAELSRHAASLGCAGVLVLPPFYYKNVSDEGLYRYFAELIEGVGDPRLQLYLYHIPQMTQVGLSISLIERLLKDYPDQIAGIKDSSGDWDHTARLLEEFQPEGFDVFAGSEPFLLQTVRQGGAGCITATANVNPGAIAQLYATWEQDDAEAQQQALNKVRAVFQQFPMIPAMKTALAVHRNQSEWKTVRPPLVQLDDQQAAKLSDMMSQIGFTAA